MKNVKKLYFIAFFAHLAPAYTIERLFWQAKGITVTQTVIFEIIYAVAVTVLEVPSGALADKFGRKRMLVINGALRSVEFVIPLFVKSFWQLAAVAVLTGVGGALESGSDSALLYDSLAANNRQEDIEKHLGRLEAISIAGATLAALSGGFTAQYLGFEFNYCLSIFSMVVAFIITLTLKEPPFVSELRERSAGIGIYIREAAGIFRLSPLLPLYCMTGAVIGSCYTYLDEFWQLILDSRGIPVVMFGVFSALKGLIGIPANLAAYKPIRRYGYKACITAVAAMSAAGYWAVLITPGAFCALPILAVLFLGELADTVTAGYLHRNVPDEVRATAESISSLALRFVSMPVGLIFGAVCGRFSVSAGVAVPAVICTLYLIFFLSAHKKA